MIKQCTKCLGKPQPLENFYKSKRGLYGHKSQCKVCDKYQHKEWVTANPDKVAKIDRRHAVANPEKCRAKKKRWQKKYPEKVNAKRIEKLYGLNSVQYNALFEYQKDLCALCKRHKSANALGLHVDHNHANKRVRGLLCPSCNQALGLLQDSPELCQLASIYLIDDGKWIERIINPDLISSHGQEDTDG